jgi:hypothetical protein
MSNSKTIQFNITLNPGSTLNGESSQIANLAAALPAPSALTLLSLGGLAFAGYGWRRRKQSA